MKEPQKGSGQPDGDNNPRNVTRRALIAGMAAIAGAVLEEKTHLLKGFAQLFGQESHAPELDPVATADWGPGTPPDNAEISSKQVSFSVLVKLKPGVDPREVQFALTTDALGENVDKTYNPQGGWLVVGKQQIPEGAQPDENGFFTIKFTVDLDDPKNGFQAIPFNRPLTFACDAHPIIDGQVSPAPERNIANFRHITRIPPTSQP